MRADAERSTDQILKAAEVVLAADPNASLERIGDAAGVARATVHRRFASRQALLEAMRAGLHERYLLGLEQARVRTAPPLIALYRVTEIVFELKASHPYSISFGLSTEPEVQDGLDLLFARLCADGTITAPRPAWSRQVYLALMHEVALLPVDAPELTDPGGRPDLLVKTTLNALGGR